jgi:parvulin-like peptidyl-prolyl isomerase
VVSRYREQLAAKQKPARTVTEADIQGFYQANVERYRVNERVNAAMIHLPLSWKATPERRAELTQLADRLRAQAEAAAGDRPSFGLLALTNSAHQASRYRGGELGWLDRQAASQTFEPAVVEAMFALPQPGVVSAVVTGRDGLYLFRRGP